MEQAYNGLRNPSGLSFETPLTRRSILASYWLVILLALPLWWYTTSIERLSLPGAQVLAHAEKEIRFPLNIRLHCPSDCTLLARDLQHLLQFRVSQDPYGWRGVEVRVNASQMTESSRRPGTYDVTLTTESRQPVLHGRELCNKWDTTDVSVASILAEDLSMLLVPYSGHSGLEKREHLVAKYASRYRISFTLLNEDAAAGKAAMSWNIQDALTRNIDPILDPLTNLHNFTIESQMQFHAPLAFSPAVTKFGEGEVYGLTPEHLTVFVNSAEWTLSSSVTNDPVLHFILFVPSASRRPLHILNANGTVSTSHAFILPQWGGVFIYNPAPDLQGHVHLSASDLDPVFTVFGQQLLALLGVPPLPRGITSLDSPLSDWQIDALIRRRSLENVQGARETLQSIIKLVDQIQNMPIGQDVKDDIEHALTALDETYAATTLSPKFAFSHSNRALALASRAFFNPGMLALLYFPPEHRLAVYTPLFASATVPLIAAVLRELLTWRRQRKEQTESRRVKITDDKGKQKID